MERDVPSGDEADLGGGERNPPVHGPCRGSRLPGGLLHLDPVGAAIHRRQHRFIAAGRPAALFVQEKHPERGSRNLGKLHPVLAAFGRAPEPFLGDHPAHGIVQKEQRERLFAEGRQLPVDAAIGSGQAHTPFVAVFPDPAHRHAARGGRKRNILDVQHGLRFVVEILHLPVLGSRRGGPSRQGARHGHDPRK